MSAIVLFGLLLGLCFLYGLNLHLRGTLTDTIGGVIGLLIVATVVAVFVFLGWRLGLVALGVTAISIPMMESITRPLVARRLAHPTPRRDDQLPVDRPKPPSDPPAPPDGRPEPAPRPESPEAVREPHHERHRDQSSSGLTPKRALDTIVAALADIDVRLSGDDSPLETPWEEIKEQLQHGLTEDWPAYVATIEQYTSGFIGDLDRDDLASLMTALKCSSADALQRKLIQRLYSRGKKEAVRYAPFDFEFFSYVLADFTVYCQVLQRTGLTTCHALAFSSAAPTGEQGDVDCSHIEALLTRDQFESARARGWPLRWTP
jgi:hypothetical protein